MFVRLFKMAKKEENKRKGITFREIIGGEFLTRQSLVSQMPFFFFIVALFFIQISMIYYFESVQIEIKNHCENHQQQKRWSLYNFQLSWPMEGLRLEKLQ